MSSSPLRPVLVSACLLGRRCRYDGSHNTDEVLEAELEARGERAVPCCPEEAGGLSTPRPPAWLTAAAAEVVAGRAEVVTEDGERVTGAFLAGARRAVERARAEGARRAYLKERSPSCGVTATHVAAPLGGSAPVAGPGVTAELLRQGGIEVVGVEGRRRGEAGEESPGTGAAGDPAGDG